MSFPRYGSYRDSEVEWLGEVPSHWQTLKLSRVVDPRRPITYGIVQGGPDTAGGVPYIRPADMSDESGVRDIGGLLRTTEEIATAYRRSTVIEGDLVCSIGPSFGKVMVVPRELTGANLTQGTARVAVGESDCARFVFWVLRSCTSVAQWESAIGGATFRALNLEPLACTSIPRPPYPEQVVIAEFLDRETARIDALVEEQRRLVDLLKEKRQAVVFHAVTKGLDPAAPTKDSGVEWLGEVPAHWTVRPIRKVAKLETGHTPSRQRPEYWVEQECVIPWFTLADVGGLRDGERVYVEETEHKISPLGMENSAARLLPAGTVFLSRTASVGFSGIMATDMAVSQDFAAWVCADELSPEYLLLCLRAMTPEFRRLMVGSTHQTIYMPDIERLTIPVPPLDEQKSIATQALTAKGELEALMQQATFSMSLLKERRAALITAAVTGKIDVRGLARTEQPAAEAA